MDWQRPVLMGVVNVTPDSFSDGGPFLETENGGGRTVAGSPRRARDILDVGGESTRPGAELVPEDEELWRVDPGASRGSPAPGPCSRSTR